MADQKTDNPSANDKPVTDPDDPSHTLPQPPHYSLPRFVFVSHIIPGEAERPHIAVPNEDNLLSNVGETGSLSYTAGTYSPGRPEAKKNPPDSHGKPGILDGISADIEVAVDKISDLVDITLKDVKIDITILEIHITRNPTQPPESPTQPPESPTQPPENPTEIPNDSGMHVSPDLIPEDSAHPKFNQIMRDLKTMEFRSPGDMNGYLESELQKAGIEIRLTPNGFEVSEEPEVFDPMGVGGRMRKKGIKDKTVIEQAIDEVNSRVRGVESFSG